MTPIVLLILVGMWAAVLLPPYLRDRNDNRTTSSRGPVSDKLDALSRSFGNRERSRYLPVASSSLGTPQQPGSPLPAGARHPLTRRGVPQAVPDWPEPQSSAVQILPLDGARADEEEARYLLAPEVDDELSAPPARREIPAPVLAARTARKRRQRDVLFTLLAAAGLSFLMAIGLGGPVILLHVLLDVALVAYVAMLVRHQKARAEREIKVAFLPHGGEGIAPSDLLAQGGGFRPGEAELASVELETTAFRVVRSQAN